ncbi:hypothetical protein ACHAQH_005686 [Verticillium albo-atrum]
MSFDDMLQTFSHIHRTRLFDERWTVVQRWTAAHVARVTGYLRSKFVLEVKKAGLVVLVLAQLDDRYFDGFSGGHSFEVHFTLQEAESGKDGQSEQICRVRPAHEMENRSISCEVELEAGRYEVIPKITATRQKDTMSVGMQYDLAHAKGGVPDEDGMLESKKTELKRKKAEKKKKLAERKQQEKLEKQKRRALKQAKKAMRKASRAVDEVAKAEVEASDGKSLGKEQTKVKTATDAGEKEKDKEKDSDSWTDVKGTDKDSVNNSIADSTPTEEGSKTSGDEHAKPAKTDTKTAAADDNHPLRRLPRPQSHPQPLRFLLPLANTASDASYDSGDEPEKLWNAVCVIGLRVYARDPFVSVTLVKPDDDSEGAV